MSSLMVAVGAAWAGGAVVYSLFRRRVGSLELQLRALRHELEEDIEFREPGPGDGDLVARKDQLEPSVRDETARGGTLIATLIEQRPERQPLAIAMWLVFNTALPSGNADGPGQARPVGEAGTTAVRVGIPYTLGKARVTVSEVELATRVATPDELIAALRANHAKMIAWRHAQPPDALLEHDLRAMLGANYDRQGPRLLARMTDKLPRATLRRH
jgi:hypothetical protein